ncbi:hypothetical protein [Sphingomonas sp. SUN039]|uniref:hypothetical protein n=1 Tax=Sphingomonas sp. SUN039 TaxID=2937787 RepID=UPI00216407B5|nr:hypothetical protein [Sphingomonas sp. SUN039]UVO52652.1 hypothetical protein M0209_00380 [Sphingomonas sp. SUN039]
MMRVRRLLALGLALAITSGAVAATPDAAAFPSGVSTGSSPLGRVYVGKDGRTLYGLSLRSVRARTSLTLTYCTGPCAAAWTPLKAPGDAKPVGSWTVVQGAQGPQWAFDGSPVFAFNADAKPGDIGGDHWKDLFLALGYIPPKPEIVAPPSVDARLTDVGYVLADSGGRALFASACASACGARTPFAAAAASLPVGDWTILRDRDRPQWAWRGSAVFVAADASSTDVAAGDVLLTLSTERQ